MSANCHSTGHSIGNVQFLKLRRDLPQGEMDVACLHKEPLRLGNRRVAPAPYSFLERLHLTPFYACACSFARKQRAEVSTLYAKKARRSRRAFIIESGITPGGADKL
jgi:hypothetical protein